MSFCILVRISRLYQGNKLSLKSQCVNHQKCIYFLTPINVKWRWVEPFLLKIYQATKQVKITSYYNAILGFHEIPVPHVPPSPRSLVTTCSMASSWLKLLHRGNRAVNTPYCVCQLSLLLFLFTLDMSCYKLLLVVNTLIFVSVTIHRYIFIYIT